MQMNGMQELGFEYVNLDDCWAYERNSSGHLTWDTQRFPSGMPALADWLHQRHFKLGLYTSAGNQTCSSGGRPVAIPGSRGSYDLDAKTFASWQIDYIKLDWCGDIKDQVGSKCSQCSQCSRCKHCFTCSDLLSSLWILSARFGTEKARTKNLRQL
jgi:hypothetical protein